MGRVRARKTCISRFSCAFHFVSVRSEVKWGGILSEGGAGCA
jgi:hypothetical protein